jgi:hypothetical protein
MIHITDFFSECRIWTASKADFDPPRTTTFLIESEERRGTLAARERVWIIDGVKDSVVKEGRFGVEVRPVAMMSFWQVKDLSESAETVQTLLVLVMCLTKLLKMMRSRIVFPANDL